jgi:hypothetical protein
MKNIEATPPPQIRSTLNGPIEHQIQAVQNDSPFPRIELDISPQLASHWLEWNQCQRRLIQRRIDWLAHAMEIGEFHYVADPIRLGELDKKTLRRPLRDGQHRLSAIVVSGKTMRLSVIFDFPLDLFPFIDAGLPRRAADFVKQPLHLATLMAGAARYVFLFERKLNFLTKFGTPVPINVEYLDVLERHPGIEIWSKEAFKAKRMGISCVVAASYWISATGDPRSDEFLGRLYDPSGQNLTEGLYHLGERIRWERKQYFSGEQGRRLLMWAIFRAWELFQNKEARTVIRLIGGKISWPGGAPYLQQNGNHKQVLLLR